MERITVRIEDGLHRQLMKESEKMGRGGVTSVIHSALHAYFNEPQGASGKERMEMIYSLTKELLALRRMTAPVGGNLNQAMHWLNRSSGEWNEATIEKLTNCYTELRMIFAQLIDVHKQLLHLRTNK